jgi:hypothetical protein
VGAWSPGCFDNDDAQNWVGGELEGAEGAEPVTEAFAAVLEGGTCLDASQASMALAAAEVVAALIGKPAANLPHAVASWVAGKRPPAPALVHGARRVVERILQDSKVKDLWAESEHSGKWEQEVAGLVGRLEGSGFRQSD